MPITNITHYRFAKRYAEDAKDILKVVDLTTKALQPFQQYKPVVDIIDQLTKSKSVLEAHLQKAQQVLSRGKSKDDEKK